MESPLFVGHLPPDPDQDIYDAVWKAVLKAMRRDLDDALAKE